MTSEEYKAKTSENKHRSALYAELILSASDEDDLYLLLRGFIGCRYFLDPPEMTSDDLLQLGDLSTEKLAGLRRGGLEFEDRSVGCTSVASSMAKKALLVLTLGKTLHIDIDPDDAASAATVKQLAGLIQRELREQHDRSRTAAE